MGGNQTTKSEAPPLREERGAEVFQGSQCFRDYISFTHKMSSTFGESECSAPKLGKREKGVFKVFLVLKRSYSVNMNVRVESVNAEGFRPRC